MESGERDELEAIAQCGEVALETGDLGLREVAAPVERRRAVVGEQLPGEGGVDRARKRLGLLDVGRRGLEPQQIGVGRVGEPARNRGEDPVVDAEESLGRALAGDEGAVCLVDVAGQQLRRQRVGAGNEQRRHVEDVGRQPRRDQRAHELRAGHEDLAPEMPALLLRRELILEVHRRGACLDERLHQLESVQRAAEPGFGVGDDRREPVDRVVALGMSDLVGAEQRVVDPLDERRSAGRRIQALVGVGLARQVRVGRDLPAREVDRLQACLDHLDRLTAGEGAERRHPLLLLEQRPQPLRPPARERVLNDDRTAQPLHVGVTVGSFDRRASHLRSLLGSKNR